MSIEDGEDRSIATEEKEEKEQRRRRRSGAAKLRDVAEAYIKVLATEDGRTVMWDILTDLKTFHTPLVPGSQDLTYCNIGRQNAGLELMARLISASPSNYIAMQQENGK